MSNLVWEIKHHDLFLFILEIQEELNNRKDIKYYTNEQMRGKTTWS